MEYIEFKKILAPALRKLIKDNEEYIKLFGESTFEIGTASEDEIIKFENHVNISIPKFYRQFLKEYNPRGLEIMFHGLLGLREMKGHHEHIKLINKKFSADFLPIMSNNSGDYYCIRESDETIYIADHEEFYKLKSLDSITNFISSLVREKLRNKEND